MSSVPLSSWEMGTATQALLELDFSSLSTFSSAPAFHQSASFSASSIDNVLGFVRTALQQRNGSTMIIKDGSAGDPTSLGVACILGNLTGADTRISNVTFASAASDQLNYLLDVAPRSPDGAISHRVSEASNSPIPNQHIIFGFSITVQLWADFVYMVPPFLAYYGVVTGNISLVQESVNQISLYRNNLQDSPSGLWKHIALGPSIDSSHWSTGNAWAAAGMVRVLATIQHSPFAKALQTEQAELGSWVQEIHNGFYSYMDNSTFLNYNTVDNTTTFQEASGSTLMASTVYRLAVLQKKYQHIRQAENVRKAIFAANGSHIDSDGWLTPVVDPTSFSVLGSHSPESEAFILLLQSAYIDWSNAGRNGESAGARSLAASTILASLVAFGGLLWLLMDGFAA
ncbi:hypothetical protein BS47DRAFT_1486534 [Hydnum rufescens UP504]|uniref:Glycoside hydrolase family 105 protein n=1 Tax=Hydnum rufescens UP504 TaxID=1448309 RepID=A0A9P6AU85_9AGAM|nr:hypothetical protein BS47DRAFT_1486534 [Hydnum rufescens UP504]